MTTWSAHKYFLECLKVSAKTQEGHLENAITTKNDTDPYTHIDNLLHWYLCTSCRSTETNIYFEVIFLLFDLIRAIYISLINDNNTNNKITKKPLYYFHENTE